jgi:hydroxymethylpyrimidine/phosphomethylpyrimidine kinase
MTSWQGQRIDTTSTHGTGCTLASAIAFFLGEGLLACRRGRAGALFVRWRCTRRRGWGRGRADRPGRVRLDVGAGPRLNQVTVTGNDYERSVAFYRALGLKQIVDSPENGYARFETAGGATFSVQIDPEEKIVATTAIYFECDDLDERVERLARSGIPFEHGPRNQPWMWREARLRDPSATSSSSTGRRSAPLPAVADGRTESRQSTEPFQTRKKRGWRQIAQISMPAYPAR